MTTIYTVNNKVLKNSANDKWLTKKAGPAGFVMNASNVVGTSSGVFTYWNGPNYPERCDLEGKTVIVTVTEAITIPAQGWRISYATRTDGQEERMPLIDYQTPTDGIITPGTYTYTAKRNTTPVSYDYGKYIALDAINTSDVSKISIQILDV